MATDCMNGNPSRLLYFIELNKFKQKPMNNNNKTSHCKENDLVKILTGIGSIIKWIAGNLKVKKNGKQYCYNLCFVEFIMAKFHFILTSAPPWSDPLNTNCIFEIHSFTASVSGWVRFEFCLK